ncbi:ankyrin repeat family protein [Rickettsia endosymbiont of Ixodes pacificus]|uniref:ankyrin repeat domain-containing protein n=1 Tax=Rickettsia endosymbiont of Ixodes pacificus TaxID=1133329 RepID=UPI00061E35D2|nr:ankyrin repeat domain-containing protein [Rickettsia endosymbiont of Ixodes pacificus]KJW02171.1 ankyrin repeat family protein [Rickettsia endosymbiont of Ixodes pacificus]
MLKILENFFENKARIKIERFKQLPPLHAATAEGNISDVRIYLHRKCDVNKQDINGKTPLHHAYEKVNKEVIQILLQSHGIDKNIQDNKNYIPADYSAEFENKVDKLGEVIE